MQNNQELFLMCQDLEEMCDQLNNMSYNKKEDRDLIDSHLVKLELMHETLNGDMTSKKQYLNLNKTYKQ